MGEIIFHVDLPMMAIAGVMNPSDWGLGVTHEDPYHQGGEVRQIRGYVAHTQALLVQPMSVTLLFVGLFPVNSLTWYVNLLFPYNSPLLIPAFALVSCTYAWLVATVLLRYTKELDVIHRQLQEFSFTEARCFCCERDHQGQTGERIVCDREVIRKCVQDWFGSVEDFERLVRTRVRKALSSHLGGHFCPYPLLVVSALPLLWSGMDFAAARLLQKDTSSALGFLVMGLSLLLMSGAILLSLIFLAIRCLPAFCSTTFQKLVAIAVTIVTGLGQHLLLQICHDSFGPFKGALAFAAILLVPSVLIWRSARRLFHRAS